MDQQKRETRQVILPSGVVAEIFTYLTGRETREIQTSFLRGAVKIVPGEQVGRQMPVPQATVDTALAQRMEDEELIRQGVAIFDGSADNILDRVLDGIGTDWTALLQELKKLQSPPPTK